MNVAYADEPLAALVHKFAHVRALVIGDAMVDQYHFGRVDRLSPEAPIPIFIEEITEPRRGGADNVAHQLEVLGCRVLSVFADTRSVKHRYFAGHHPVFRRDIDSPETPQEWAFRDVQEALAVVSVVVLSDYAKGFLSRELCQRVMGQGLPVIVDPKGRDWSKYRGATVICPNSAELALVELAALDPLTRIVEKRGASGLKVHIAREALTEIIPATAQQVFDVTGAGDVVTALIAAGVAVGATLHEAATLANHAAGIVVGKIGTAVCTKAELLATLA